MKKCEKYVQFYKIVVYESFLIKWVALISSVRLSFKLSLLCKQNGLVQRFENVQCLICHMNYGKKWLYDVHGFSLVWT